ncbi:MAG: hypothetical protein A2147_06040 [Chloroflexi bacterium RBG_16_57_8]|nr:MAG: hypothetical protein A2147_06040 [Chloroflexi bacterium RBG_16_57_8]
MTQDRDYARLRHMIDFSSRAVDLSERRHREDLDTDEVLALALLRLAELLGEAARNVSPALRARHPEIPWTSIVGTRDRLAHGYMKVNYEVMWEIIVGDLPSLIARLETLIEDDFEDARP